MKTRKRSAKHTVWHRNHAEHIISNLMGFTNQIFIEKSGKPLPENIHLEIRRRLPQQSQTPWDMLNCAEIKACNKALNARADAKMDDLDIATVKVRNGEPIERCANSEWEQSACSQEG